MSSIWQPREYLVRVAFPTRGDPRIAVRGLVSPDGVWGVGSAIAGSGSPFWIDLTHLPTGLGLAPGFYTTEEARTFAQAINHLLPWRNVRGMEDVPLDVRAAARDAYTRITGRSWHTGRPLSLRSRQVRRRRERIEQEVAAR